MSKANKSARQKVVGGLNWWDFLNSIRPHGFRNTPQYLDYDMIISRASEIKKLNKITKNRKKQEKKQLKTAKYPTNLDKIIKIKKAMTSTPRINKKNKMNKLSEQIQYGFDIAKWWGEQHEI